MYDLMIERKKMKCSKQKIKNREKHVRVQDWVRRRYALDASEQLLSVLVTKVLRLCQQNM